MRSYLAEQKKQLEKALLRIDRHAVVVSGPQGCGKTYFIRKVCREKQYIIAEIEKEEEWAYKGLEESRVCLMRVDEAGKIKRRPYTGIVFETDMPYLYRMIPGCIHIKIPKPTQKMASYISGIQRAPPNLHKALLAARTLPRAQRRLLEDKAHEISLYHLVAKILYRKTEAIPIEAISLLESVSPEKMLLYLHENIPFFVEDVSALGEILDSLSLCVFMQNKRSYLFQGIYKIWKSPRHTPQSFYSIKSSSFYFSKAP